MAHLLVSCLDQEWAIQNPSLDFFLQIMRVGLLLIPEVYTYKPWGVLGGCVWSYVKKAALHREAEMREGVLKSLESTNSDVPFA